ncbi:MAG: extracellular solute-binding protein [Alphaproteobacteria bacterium]|nr:extracellular solute-binding protein [Alphaproteobacteria bacterium]
MSKTVNLRGLTWDHPRASDGLLAETRRFNSMDINVSVEWDVHSLRGFEATPIAETAAEYDLIILDHPFMGDAAKDRILVDLHSHLEPDSLDGLRTSYVGLSFESYEYDGGLWALPVDAASQAAVYRSDLMDGPVPKNFAEVTELGRRGGLGMSLANPHAFMAYLGIAASLGADISGTSERLIPEDVALQTLSILREWVRYVPEAAFDWSSIGLLEAMATSGTVSYCPMVFSFNSYAQTPKPGRMRLTYCNIPAQSEKMGCQRPVLGGTGLAVSASSRNIAAAVNVALHFVGQDAQTRMASDGGQPAHRSVWSPSAPPTLNGTFFVDCAPAQKAAVLRPRWPNYIELQNKAGQLLNDDLSVQSRPLRQTIEDIEAILQSVRI